MVRSPRAAAIAVAALLFVSGCGRPDRPRQSDSKARIELKTPPGGTATIDVVGLSAADLSQLEHRAFTPEEWTALLRIAVPASGTVPADRPAVLGTYVVADAAVRFTPRFPLDPGQRYDVVFDPSRLPSSSSELHTTWR